MVDSSEDDRGVMQEGGADSDYNPDKPLDPSKEAKNGDSDEEYTHEKKCRRGYELHLRTATP